VIQGMIESVELPEKVCKKACRFMHVPGFITRMF
jgi:hypothetical protein